MGKVIVYLEGGGKGKEGPAALRQGMTEFLGRVVDRRRIQVICCGAVPVQEYRACKLASPSDHRVLLVDSEAPVDGSPAQVVASRAGRAAGELVDDDCLLMVQCMESWLVADAAALEAFFGAGFRKSALPRRKNIEDEPKDQVLGKLRAAVAKTAKQKYHKINHGAVLLGKIDPSVVRQRAPHCHRLLTRLTELTTGSP